MIGGHILPQNQERNKKLDFALKKEKKYIYF